MPSEEKPAQNHPESLWPRKKTLTEPAPALPKNGRVRITDGLDNSDLKMLLALATQKAKRKKE